MKYIIGNFKMNLKNSEILNYLEEMKDVSNENVNIIYVPSNIYISEFIKNKLNVGIQNVSEYQKGAYTGETSASQASSVGVKYALVGHSERRQVFNESNEIINNKIKQCLDNSIIPVLCIGETLEEKNNNETSKVLNHQIKTALENIDDTSNIIIAYEPIWAIGTGEIPNIEDINQICLDIKEYVQKEYNSSNIVLYGGSVNSSNSIEILNKEHINGVLIGGASIKIEEFKKIIRNV